MTNNPTIDGVSRCKTCRGLGWIDNLRSVGAPAAKCPDCAPAVERQEPDYSCFDRVESVDLDHVEAFLNSRSDNACFFPIDAHRLSNIAAHCSREVRASRATIARLEARVAELESGRGEPVAYGCFGLEVNGESCDFVTIESPAVQAEKSEKKK